jgi:hypothetical protein
MRADAGNGAAQRAAELRISMLASGASVLAAIADDLALARDAAKS